MTANLKNANALQEQGESKNKSFKKQLNHNKPKPQHQALYGWHLYEYLKRSFVESNPNSTSIEYDQACHRFARLAGV